MKGSGTTYDLSQMVRLLSTSRCHDSHSIIPAKYGRFLDEMRAAMRGDVMTIVQRKKYIYDVTSSAANG